MVKHRPPKRHQFHPPNDIQLPLYQLLLPTPRNAEDHHPPNVVVVVTPMKKMPTMIIAMMKMTLMMPTMILIFADIVDQRKTNESDLPPAKTPTGRVQNNGATKD